MEIIPALSLTGRAAQAAVVAVLLAALFLMARPPAGADIGRRAPRDGGVLTSVHLDNPASGFAARDAQVYLPPAYFAHPRPKLPVVVLVSGVPGSPEQWFAEGRAGQALDAFAEDHRGLAPTTVAVDANGTVFKDTLCVDSPATGDKVMTYLAEDVPAALQSSSASTRTPRIPWPRTSAGTGRRTTLSTR